MIHHSVSETKKKESRKFLIVGAAAFVAILFLFVGVAGFFVWRSRGREAELTGQIGEVRDRIASERANAPIGAADINDKYGKAVVYIEVAWRLINTQRQAQMYHQFIPNDRRVLTRMFGVNYGTGPIDPTAPGAIPVYVQVGET